MTLLRYRPLTFTLLDRLMDELASEPPVPAPQATGEGYTISLALPGVPPELIDMTVTGSTLSITVNERSNQERDDDSYRAAVAGRKSFSWLLPEGVDAEGIRATSEHGMLTVTVPKAESARPRRIEIDQPVTKQVGPGTEAAAQHQEAVTSAT